METTTLNLKKEVPTSTSNHEKGYNKHPIQLELENGDEECAKPAPHTETMGNDVDYIVRTSKETAIY